MITRDYSMTCEKLAFPDFEVMCAVAEPSGNGLLLGSDDGRIRWFDPSRPNPLVDVRVAESEDVVNGIACWKNHIAVSTPSKVVVGLYSELGKSSLMTATFPGGAARGDRHTIRAFCCAAWILRAAYRKSGRASSGGVRIQ